MPDPVRDHSGSIANTAVRFLRYLERRNETHSISWKARIGLATGPVIGSVVDVQKYIYDVFGPAVAAADTIRLAAQPMGIAAHRSIADLLDSRFAVSAIGDVAAGTPAITEAFALTESDSPGAS